MPRRPSCTRGGRASRRARCSPTRRRLSTLPVRLRCSNGSPARIGRAAWSCCCSSARRACAPASGRAYWGPSTLERRLSDSTELLTYARQARDLELELQGHAWLVVDLLEHGDSEAVDAQIEAFSAGAERLRQPLYLWNAAVWRA